MKKFKQAIENFEQHDLNNYSAEINEIITENYLYQFRIRRKTSELVIIQFGQNGGYNTFTQDSNDIAFLESKVYILNKNKNITTSETLKKNI